MIERTMETWFDPLRRLGEQLAASIGETFGRVEIGPTGIAGDGASPERFSGLGRLVTMPLTGRDSTGISPSALASLSGAMTDRPTHDERSQLDLLRRQLETQESIRQTLEGGASTSPAATFGR